MSRVVPFYLDYISHNAWLAWVGLRELAGRHALRIEPQPVLFAALLNHTGMKGPAEVPEKAAWMIRNVVRKSIAAQIPLSPPASHPFNPLLALRCTLACAAGGERIAAVDALFRATWSDGADVSDPNTVRAVLDAADLDGAALVTAAAGDDIKAALRTANEDALARGVFGVPSMIVDGELFWGYDDLPWVEARMNGSDPLDGLDLTAWSTIKPSARR